MAEPRRGLSLYSLRERVRHLAERQVPDGALVRAVAERAGRVLARLEGTAEVLEQVARLELRILQKLEPIVDDLGRLVRAQVAQTLGRQEPERAARDEDIIDV